MQRDRRGCRVNLFMSRIGFLHMIVARHAATANFLFVLTILWSNIRSPITNKRTKVLLKKCLTTASLCGNIIVTKERKVVKMTRVGKVLGIVSWLFVGYLGISWIDVVLHNLDDEPIYQAWNIFALLFLQ